MCFCVCVHDTGKLWLDNTNFSLTCVLRLVCVWGWWGGGGVWCVHVRSDLRMSLREITPLTEQALLWCFNCLSFTAFVFVVLIDYGAMYYMYDLKWCWDRTQCPYWKERWLPVQKIERYGLFVVVFSNSISVLSWQWDDVWDEKEKARAYTFIESRDL